VWRSNTILASGQLHIKGYTKSAVLALAVLVATIGLADSLNPSTLGPALVIATGEGAATRLMAFTAGVFGVSLAAGLLLVLGPGQVLLGALPHPSPKAKHIAQVAGGVLLIGLGVAAWLGRRRLARDLTSDRDGRTGAGVLSALGLGAGIMAVEIPTAVPYFAAIAAILGAHVGATTQVILVGIYNVAFVLPLLLVIAIRAWAGREAADALERTRRWLGRRAGAILASVLGVAGAALLGLGIAGLA
jgi:cytochrome c biogenesis protein CcdA